MTLPNLLSIAFFIKLYDQTIMVIKNALLEVLCFLSEDIIWLQYSTSTKNLLCLYMENAAGIFLNILERS